MNKIIIFSHGCMPCSQRSAYYSITRQVKQAGHELHIIDVSRDRQQRERAAQVSTLQLPYAYNETTGQYAPITSVISLL
jgi:hypothetical protein